MQEQTGAHTVVERGFTMIELLVVIAILGILAAVAIFSVTGIVDRGAASACKAEVSTVNAANQAYYAKMKTYPGQGAADDSVVDLGADLVGAHLLASGSALPSATLNYTPGYDSSDGMFSAAC